jgi:hypothetical protein
MMLAVALQAIVWPVCWMILASINNPPRPRKTLIIGRLGVSVILAERE